MEGVGILIINKQNGLLFQRSTRYANRTMMYNSEFTDDVIFFDQSREAACAAIKAYLEVASSLGLTVSFPKIKFMVIGSAVCEEDQQPLAVKMV